MNLTWHIVKKDFRRLQLPLFLWTVLLGAQAVLCMRLFSARAGNAEWIEQQSGIITALAGVGWLFTFVLTAAFVLEDPLTGTQMFWATRPISGRRLLGAKTLGVLVALVVWPVVVALPSWIYFGLGARDLVAAAERIVLVQVAIVIVGGTLAAVAGQGSRFLFWMLALLVGIPLAMGVVTIHAPAGISPDAKSTRLFLTVVVLLGSTLTVTWLQFTSRRIGRSLAVLAGGLGLTVILCLVWRWNWVALWPHSHEQAPGTEPIELSVLSGAFQAEGGGDSRLVLNLQARNVPDDFSLVPGGRVEADFRWADGTTLSLSSTLRVHSLWAGYAKLLRASAPNPDKETEAKLRQSVADLDERAMRRTGKPAPSGVGQTSLEAIFTVDPQWTERFHAAVPACTLRMRVLTSHPKVAAELPLQEGADRIGSGARMRIVRYGDEYRPKPGQRGQKNLYVMVSRPTTNAFVDFRVTDRVHGTESWVYSGSGPGSLLTVGFLPVRFDWQFVAIPYPRAWRTDKWVDMPAWLQDYTLAFVIFSPDGGFDRELKIDRLPIGP
ncbi:MAG TPA: hypothetical protein VHD61_00855 [Lacunisphaera sp.]|nr:hypothetical protein [Lacunisphaera sp.]